MQLPPSLQSTHLRDLTIGLSSVLADDIRVVVVNSDTDSPSQTILDAIDEANNDLPEGTRGVVILSPGEYVLERQLFLPDNSTLIGSAWVTHHPDPPKTRTARVTLWPKMKNMGFMCVPGTNCYIQGIHFRGSAVSSTDHEVNGCHLFGSNKRQIRSLWVEDCSFTDTQEHSTTNSWDCCKLSGDVQDVTFMRCIFSDADRSAFSVATGKGGVKKLHFNSCRFGNSGYWCVNLEPSGGSLHDVQFVACIFDTRKADNMISISLLTSQVIFRQCHFLGRPHHEIRVLYRNSTPPLTPSEISFYDCLASSGVTIHRDTLYDEYPVEPKPQILQVRTKIPLRD